MSTSVVVYAGAPQSTPELIQEHLDAARAWVAKNDVHVIAEEIEDSENPGRPALIRAIALAANNRAVLLLRHLSIFGRKCTTHIHQHRASHIRQRCTTLATDAQQKRLGF